MKAKKFLSLLAAALMLCLILAIPLSASAAPGDYLYFDEDEIYIYIPAGASSAQDQISFHTNLNPNLLTWYSNDSSVVRVNKDGLLTAQKSGTAVVTASFVNTKTSCKVTVYKEKASTLNTKSAALSIQYNDPHPTIKLYLSETAVLDGIRQWSSSNPAVATVDQTGLVTAQAAGTATIYVSTRLGSTLSCTVTVVNDIGKVTVNHSQLLLENIGGQSQLVASVALEDPSAVTITWTSDNPAVATVDAAGLVTAVGNGEATITATGTNGRTAACKVYAGSAARQQETSDWLEDWFGI